MAVLPRLPPWLSSQVITSSAVNEWSEFGWANTGGNATELARGTVVKPSPSELGCAATGCGTRSSLETPIADRRLRCGCMTAPRTAATIVATAPINATPMASDI